MANGDVSQAAINAMRQGSAQEEVACALCFDAKADTVLMECGHGGICFRCGSKLLRLKGNCPMCRESVALILRLDNIVRPGDYVKVVDFIEGNRSPLPNSAHQSLGH